MGRQARNDDTMLFRSAEMTGRTQTLPWWGRGKDDRKQIGHVGPDPSTPQTSPPPLPTVVLWIRIQADRIILPNPVVSALFSGSDFLDIKICLIFAHIYSLLMSHMLLWKSLKKLYSFAVVLFLYVHNNVKSLEVVPGPDKFNGSPTMQTLPLIT